MTQPTSRSIFVLLAFAFTCGQCDTSFALSTSFSSVDLDLEDPSTGNNRFETLFQITEPGLGVDIEGGPVTVDYIDENQTGIQVDLDIDFSDLDNPFASSIEFVGEPGDISHVFTGGAIEVLFNNGLISIDADVVPNGIKGFLRTQGGPIAVNPDGSFESGNTNLVARQGTVDIDGTLTSFLGAVPIDETFSLADTPVDQFNDSISTGVVNDVQIDFVGIDGDERVYSVAVTTLLENTQLPFDDNGFNLIIDITGTFRGVGEIRIAAVPEPASATCLLLTMTGAAVLRRRRQ
ncbi:MAG: PEP-CTERM sorting domain-containing protein [Lacipirellulaceae bacterium]